MPENRKRVTIEAASFQVFLIGTQEWLQMTLFSPFVTSPWHVKQSDICSMVTLKDGERTSLSSIGSW